MRCLIVGEGDDPHTVAVVEKIRALGSDPIVFDYRVDRLLIEPSAAHLSTFTIQTQNQRAESSEITAVWFRLKPAPIEPSDNPLEASARAFRQSEWRAALRSLYSFIPTAKWINSIPRLTAAASKAGQLHLAQSIGLTVPDSLITNDHEAVSMFLQRHGRVIYKSLEWFTFPDLRGIFTTEIGKKEVEGRMLNIGAAPGIYQQFIEKSYELRVTVVGTQCFAARINTPTQGKASIDWRHAHFDDIFSIADLDCSPSAPMAQI